MSSTLNKAAAIQKIKAKQAAAGKAQATGASSPSAAAASSSSFPLPARPVRSRWAVDLTERPALGALTPSGFSSAELLPPGFVSVLSAPSSSDSSSDAKSVREKGANDAQQADLLYKSAMAIATAPGKQLMMTAFMLWMSGNTLQIFSIMMLGMAMWTPISELFNVQTKFARYADSGIDLIVPKLTFIAMNLAGLSVGLYKCNTMGLLPTSASDWLDASVRPALQVAGGGF